MTTATRQYHWTVFEGEDPKGKYQMYSPAEKPPNGSRTTAHEIEGMPKSKAIKVLNTMYDSVWTRKDTGVIICRNK